MLEIRSLWTKCGEKPVNLTISSWFGLFLSMLRWYPAKSGHFKQNPVIISKLRPLHSKSGHCGRHAVKTGKVRAKKKKRFWKKIYFTASQLHSFTASRLHGFRASELHVLLGKTTVFILPHDADKWHLRLTYEVNLRFITKGDKVQQRQATEKPLLFAEYTPA